MYRVSYFTIVGRLNQFVIGIGLAYLFETGRLTLKGSRKAGFVGLAFAGVAALALVMVLNRAGGIYVWHFWRIIYPEVEGLIAATLIAAYLVSRPFDGTWVSRAMVGIGTISFSIYILHYAVLGEFWNIVYPRFFAGWVSNLYVVVAITAVLASAIFVLSWLSYQCIEKPFLEMRGKYLKARAVPDNSLSRLHEGRDF